MPTTTKASSLPEQSENRAFNPDWSESTSGMAYYWFDM